MATNRKMWIGIIESLMESRSDLPCFVSRERETRETRERIFLSSRSPPLLPAPVLLEKKMLEIENQHVIHVADLLLSGNLLQYSLHALASFFALQLFTSFIMTAACGNGRQTEHHFFTSKFSQYKFQGSRWRVAVALRCSAWGPARSRGGSSQMS